MCSTKYMIYIPSIQAMQDWPQKKAKIYVIQNSMNVLAAGIMKDEVTGIEEFDWWTTEGLILARSEMCAGQTHVHMYLLELHWICIHPITQELLGQAVLIIMYRHLSLTSRPKSYYMYDLHMDSLNSDKTSQVCYDLGQNQA